MAPRGALRQRGGILARAVRRRLQKQRRLAPHVAGDPGRPNRCGGSRFPLSECSEPQSAGRASNLLFDFAAQRLGADSFGRKVAPTDWDRAGLIAAPITSIAGVQVQPDQDGNGLFLKDVRTTTLKKILASFISIERLGAVGLTDAQLTPVLARLEQAGRRLVTGYPFSDLRQFEQVRALAYADLAAAQIRLQLHRQPQTRSIVKIHFGPPGTGKTLSAVRDAVKLLIQRLRLNTAGLFQAFQ